MKYLFITSGFISLGLGVIGIILPILPTTPFLILSGFLFSKGSSKYSDWFKNTTIYRKHLREFIENKTMSKRQKWTLLLGVDMMLMISFVSIQNITLRVAIILLIIVKHWYFYKYIRVNKAYN